jgi:hypothetical protein
MVSKKLTPVKLSELIGGFCKQNQLAFEKGLGRPPRLSFSAVLTIFIYFLLSRRKDFKAFYCDDGRGILEGIFPNLVWTMWTSKANYP